MAAESDVEVTGAGDVVIPSSAAELLDSMQLVTADHAAAINEATEARDAADAEVAKNKAEREKQDAAIQTLLSEIRACRQKTAAIAIDLYRDGAISLEEYLVVAAAAACREPEISQTKLRLISQQAKMLGEFSSNKIQPVVHQSGSSVRAYMTTGNSPQILANGVVAIEAEIPGRGERELVIDPRTLVTDEGDMSNHDIYLGKDGLLNMSVAFLLERIQHGRVTQNVAGFINELEIVGIKLQELDVPPKLLEMILNDLYRRAADVDHDDVHGTMEAVSNLDQRPTTEVKALLEEAIVAALADRMISGGDFYMSPLRTKASILVYDGGSELYPATIEAKVEDIVDSARRMASWKGLKAGV
jgi:hypothetical protein